VYLYHVLAALTTSSWVAWTSVVCSSSVQ